MRATSGSGSISETTAQSILEFHRGPILCMQSNDELLITGSEDKKIFITDLRMTKSYLKKIEVVYKDEILIDLIIN